MFMFYQGRIKRLVRSVRNPFPQQFRCHVEYAEQSDRLEASGRAATTGVLLWRVQKTRYTK